MRAPDDIARIVKVLQRKLSTGRLPAHQRSRIANIANQLTHLRAPLNDIHAARLRHMLAMQLRTYPAAETAVTQTTAEGKRP
jgi:hypothetical protein